jgi:hypothetical protein
VRVSECVSVDVRVCSNLKCVVSCPAGLPVSHVVLGTSETSVSSFKDSLLGIGRLAATVNSAASR